MNENTMDELDRRIMELSFEGYHCGQIMLILGQELRGTENTELVKAMTGLNSGIHKGEACGTLTGAACLIATYVGKVSYEEEVNTLCNLMCYELVEWFEKEFKTTQCRELVSDDYADRMVVCPMLIKKTFLQVIKLLENHQIDPYS